MQEKEITERVIAVIRRVGKLGDRREIRLEDDLFIDFGLESIVGLKILAEIEDQLEVVLPEERLAGLNTVAALVQAVHEARCAA